MKLSIIIPVYNEVQFVRRCLDSVGANADVEVIIIDDGSTDGSLEICQEYTNDGFKIIQNEHSGVSVARNTGIAEANGEYITFLDSDDYFAPNGVTTMLGVLAERTDPVIQFNHSRLKYFNSEGYYPISKLPRKWILVWNKAYNRDFIINNNIEFPAEVSFQEDRIFNLKCFNHCNRIYNSVHTIVNKCFDNTNSICHTVSAQKLLSSSNALTSMLTDEDTTMEVRKIIRSSLANLWDSADAKQVFGT